MQVQIPTGKRQIGLWAGSLILLPVLVVVAIVFLSTMLKPSSRKTPPATRVVTGKISAPPPQIASMATQTAAEAEATPLAGAKDLSAAPPATAITVTALSEIAAELGKKTGSEKSSDLSFTGRFAVQVGAFKEAVNARQEMKKMQKRGLRAFHYKRADTGQQVWHVVCIGSYTTLDEASTAAKAFDGRYQTGAFGISVTTLELVAATE